MTNDVDYLSMYLLAIYMYLYWRKVKLNHLSIFKMKLSFLLVSSKSYVCVCVYALYFMGSKFLIRIIYIYMICKYFLLFTCYFFTFLKVLFKAWRLKSNLSLLWLSGVRAKRILPNPGLKTDANLSFWVL
jgi:hypothetical protein